MKEIVLREYQQECIARLRDGIRAGHRSQILCAPTGAGKTLVATMLMDEARKKHSRVAFVVDRINLVDQTSAVLDEYGIEHGVIQAGHWRRQGYQPIQICSAQTLEKRGFFPDLQLLIVDEAHAIRKETASLIKNRPDLRVIGLSATPFTKGLGQLYSNVINVTTTNKLIEEGFLVPLKLYSATAPDMSGAKIIAGEWSEKDIEQRGMAIVGDIVAEWIDKSRLHFGGPAKTIVFSATVDHGEELCRQFNAAGFNFQQISYRDTSDERRRDVIAEFRRPNSEIDGLVSCEVFTKGFDVPGVAIGISARPYRKSLSSHIQQIGRVLRPSPSKDFAVWLCHSGNIMRFKADMDDVFANGCGSLGDGEYDAKARKEPTAEERAEIRCSCGYVLSPAMRVCPACGKERVRLSQVETKPGVMVEVGGKKVEAVGKYEFLRNPEEVWRQLVHIGLTRKQGDEEAARRFAQAQYRNLFGSFARRSIDNTEPLPPTRELVGLVQHNIIRWAKGRARAAA